MAKSSPAYRDLVEMRKKCRLCEPKLVNPQIVNRDSDCEEIGAWSQWYGSLNAKIVLVGQDWGTVNYYIESEGKDNPKNEGMVNLTELFDSIGIQIDKPYFSKNDLLFFTSIVLCLKDSPKMNEKVSPVHCKWCGNLFLKPLISMLQPKVIIAMGLPAFHTICSLYGLKAYEKKNLKDVIGIESGFRILADTTVFPVYHCSPLGVANRKWDGQIADWKKVQRKLQGEGIIPWYLLFLKSDFRKLPQISG